MTILVAIPSTGLSNGDEATSSFQDNVCILSVQASADISLLTIQISVSTLPSTGVLETGSIVGTEQPITPPPYDLPSDVHVKGKGPAKSLQKSRKFISKLLRRMSVQSENKEGHIVYSANAKHERNLSNRSKDVVQALRERLRVNCEFCIRDVPRICTTNTLSKHSVIPTKSLTRVQSFAVPPGGLGNTFQCDLRIGTFKKEKVVDQSCIHPLCSTDDDSGRC